MIWYDNMMWPRKSNSPSHSLTHSVDRLTGEGSLRRPDLTITGHVPSSICSEPDVDLQLADHSRHVEDDLADASSPACHQVADLHGRWLPDEALHAQEPILTDDVDDMSEYRDTSVANSAADASLMDLSIYLSLFAQTMHNSMINCQQYDIEQDW